MSRYTFRDRADALLAAVRFPSPPRSLLHLDSAAANSMRFLDNECTGDVNIASGIVTEVSFPASTVERTPRIPFADDVAVRAIESHCPPEASGVGLHRLECHAARLTARVPESECRD